MHALSLFYVNRVWLVFWLLNNMGVTLVNKAAFANVDFRYPYFLSAVHMLCNALGCQYVFYILDRERRVVAGSKKGIVNSGEHWLVRLLGQMQRRELDASGKRLILAFSVIFSMNSK